MNGHMILTVVSIMIEQASESFISTAHCRCPWRPDAESYRQREILQSRRCQRVRYFVNIETNPVQKSLNNSSSARTNHS